MSCLSDKQCLAMSKINRVSSLEQGMSPNFRRIEYPRVSRSISIWVSWGINFNSTRPSLSITRRSPRHIGTLTKFRSPCQVDRLSPLPPGRDTRRKHRILASLCHWSPNTHKKQTTVQNYHLGRRSIILSKSPKKNPLRASRREKRNPASTDCLAVDQPPTWK